MSKIIKIFTLILFSSLLCFLTYRLCYFIAETYFFDKLFYQKSVAHGYGLYLNSKPELKKFGDRTKDLIALDSSNPSILGTTDNSEFKVTIIGDSFVWGMGLQNNQRFVHLLKKQLNKIHPTQIITLSKPGWNILDYTNIYQKIQNNYLPDLTIFFLVTNDIFINNSDNSSLLVKQCLQLNPNISATYSYDTEIAIKENFFDNETYIIDKITQKAWQNPVNKCILDKSLKLLPSNNTIYFIAEDYDENWNETKLYKKHLFNSQKYILTSNIGKNMPEYKNYWKDNIWKNFIISTVEGHPNALANQMYADILFNEITTNPQWNFTK